jgi:hypothetical protein
LFTVTTELPFLPFGFGALTSCVFTSSMRVSSKLSSRKGMGRARTGPECLRDVEISLPFNSIIAPNSRIFAPFLLFFSSSLSSSSELASEAYVYGSLTIGGNCIKQYLNILSLSSFSHSYPSPLSLFFLRWRFGCAHNSGG